VDGAGHHGLGDEQLVDRRVRGDAHQHAPTMPGVRPLNLSSTIAGGRLPCNRRPCPHEGVRPLHGNATSRAEAQAICGTRVIASA
jgi:hypothetical protein